MTPGENAPTSDDVLLGIRRSTNLTADFVDEVPERMRTGPNVTSWDAVLALLRLRPGQWLCIGPHSGAGAARLGSRFRPDGFESMQRASGGQTWLYIRWPEPPDDALTRSTR